MPASSAKAQPLEMLLKQHLLSLWSCWTCKDPRACHQKVDQTVSEQEGANPQCHGHLVELRVPGDRLDPVPDISNSAEAAQDAMDMTGKQVNLLKDIRASCSVFTIFSGTFLPIYRQQGQKKPPTHSILYSQISCQFIQLERRNTPIILFHTPSSILSISRPGQLYIPGHFSVPLVPVGKGHIESPRDNLAIQS